MDEQHAWWQKYPAEFDRFKNDLKEYESLDFEMQGMMVVVNGSWPVFGKTSLIARYRIKIELPNDFPLSVPSVYETGRRIPRESGYHINSSNDTACLFAQPERYEKWPVGAGIKEFLEGPVKEFFFSQAFFELKGEWPFGEWSHGEEGILEFYANRLGTGKLDVIEKMLQDALYPKPSRQWKCPCGSEKRLIACHGDKVKHITKVIPQVEIIRGIEIANSERAKGRNDVKLRL